MRRKKHSYVMGYLLCLINMMTISDLGLATGLGANLSDGLESELKSPITALWNQKYALCAGAESFNFNGITYAKCSKKEGNSLGLTHSYPGGDVQTVNDIGNNPDNGSFMVSTYSPPDSGRYAAYYCESKGSFAQCNGGICFTNTSGKNFPDVGPVANDEIICSCPITSSSNYHVMGPADCPTTQSQFDAICKKGSEKITRADGTILHIGSNGPVSVTVTLNALYDKTFGTTSTLKVCKRP